MLDLNKSKKYLLACSYGPDSMALFNMLLLEGYAFDVAHVNYHLREESDNEEAGLREFCSKNNINLYVRNVKPGSIKNNVEERCREIRYTYFKSLAKSYDAVLVAHNEDDHIETYLLQKKRNNIVQHYGLDRITNLNGLIVIRPILEISKDNLLDYCKENNVPFAIDKSNLEDKYERNKIRHNIVQKLSSEKRKNILFEINKNNQNLAELHNRILSSNYENIWVLQGFSDVELAIAIHFMARKIDPKVEISMRAIKELRKVINSDKPNIRCYISDKLLFIKEYSKISISFETKRPEFTYIFNEPGVLDNEYFFLDFTNGSSDRNIDLEDYPLTIRNGVPNDTIKISGYTKTLRRLFIDWKVPASLRLRWPVIINKNGEIKYVPRYREDFEITSDLNFYVK